MPDSPQSDAVASPEPAPTAEAAPAQGHGGRKFIAGLLVTLAVVTSLGTVLAWWVYDLTINTQTLVDRSERLASDPAIRRAVNTAIVTAVFSICADGEVPQGDSPCEPAAEKFVRERLPEQFQQYAPAVVNGAQSLVLDGLNRWDYAATLAPLWTVALEGAQADLLNPDADGITLGLGDVLTFLNQEFGITNLDWIERLPIPDQYTSYTLVQRQDAPVLWQAVIWIQDAAWMLPLATVVLLGLALLASTRRLRLVSNYAIAVAAVTLLTGLSVGFTRSFVVDGIPNSLNRDAAAAAWQILVTDTLRSAMWTIVVVGILLAVVARLLDSARVRSAIARAARAVWEWLQEFWASVTGKTREIADKGGEAIAARRARREGGEAEPGAPAEEGAEPGRRVGVAESAEAALENAAAWVHPRRARLLWIGGAVAGVLFLIWPSKSFGVFLTFAVLFGVWWAGLELVLMGGRRAQAAETEVPAVAGTEPDASGAAASPAVPAPAPAPISGVDLATLVQLGELRDKGVLTDAEFTEQKSRLLGVAGPPG